MEDKNKLQGKELTQGAVKPLDAFRNTLNNQKGEFQKVLPSHISFEKFQRTVMTALITNPELLSADRQSLLVACIKAATDGLLPDSRDAALVIFSTKEKTQEGERTIKKVQYLPMYAGILKKVRQSKELLSVVSHVVYAKDAFEYVLGDDERIIHEPYMGQEDRGAIIAAYCITRLKDGSIVREVMTAHDIEKVRKTSKSGNDYETGKPKGIWKLWYDEMARKTVFRRASKWLPQSIEIVERVFENDDTMEVMSDHSADDPKMIEGIANPETGEINEQPDLKVIIEDAQLDYHIHGKNTATKTLV